MSVVESDDIITLYLRFFPFIKNMFLFLFAENNFRGLAAENHCLVSFNICLIQGMPASCSFLLRICLFTLVPSVVKCNLEFYAEHYEYHFFMGNLDSVIFLQRENVLTGFCLGWAELQPISSYLTSGPFLTLYAFVGYFWSLLCPCIAQESARDVGDSTWGPLSGSFP